MFRLEKLEISGFKSFADRTTLVFGEGITGVVGPNGCGKSNIAEAISWVLGEQSPKNLRGGKMEDVIFNGTRDRKPTGMAEVLLTLVAIEDIAREADSSDKDDGQEYDQALASAEHAADTARSLVEELTPQDDSQADQQSPPDTPASETQLEAAPAETETLEPSAAVTDNQPAAQLELTPGEAVQQQGLQDELKRAEHKRTRHPRKRRVITIAAGERITVGRRLYRTGDSDYLMNGRACLLRDIQDLFAGTGLGGAHYAIIEQGRIGQILSSKPLDRRALIEEAAGITKFKSRKRAAELRLESAKQNLTRLNDIISEVERQVNSLKRQAQKARRYRRLREEMRSLLKVIFAADYRRLNESSERIAREMEEAGRNQAALEVRLAELEAENRAATAEARAAEDDLTELRQRAAAVELEADRARTRREFEQQQIAELTSRIEEINRDQRALDERLGLLESEAQRRAAALSSLEAEVAAESADLLLRESAYQEELGRLRAAESEIEELRERMLTEVGVTERLRNLASTLEDGLRRVELKQSSLLAERERAVTRRAEASDERERVSGEVESDVRRIAELAARIAELSTSLDALREQASSARAGLEEVNQRGDRARHRLASLEDLDAHRAYYSDAVQQVLSADQAARINAMGTLADFVEVEPQYERLIESLFARELQSVLVPTIDDALAGVEFLKREGLGRGAFLVVGLHGGEEDPGGGNGHETEEGSGTGDAIERWLLTGDDEPAPGSNPECVPEMRRLPAADLTLQDAIVIQLHPETPGSESEPDQHSEARRFDEQEASHASRFGLEVLRAIDLLGIRREIKSVVERAFPDKCNAAVVPDIEAALHLSIENTSTIYVTYDGEQVSGGRLIQTGAQAGQKGTSLLGLKREIKQLREQIAGIGEEQRLAAEKVAEAGQQLIAIEAEKSALDATLHEHEKSAAARNSNLAGLDRDLERAQQHVRVVEAEIEQTAAERTELETRIETLRSELAAAEASRDGVQNSLDEAGARFAELRGKLEELSQQVSSVRASVAARSERLQAAKTDLRRIEGEAEELRSRINRNKLELYENHNRVDALRSSLEEGAGAGSEFESERASLIQMIDARSARLSSARARTDELERIVSEVRQATAAAHDHRSHIEVERARIELEAEHLTRSCFSELAMSIEDVVTSVELAGQTAEVGDQKSEVSSADSVEPTSDHQPLTSGLTSDIDSVRARYDELRARLDEMGPVNMMALEELEQADERFRFLSAQRTDILESIKSTEQALAEIKRRSRERFRHAFIHINENFQRMFVELFGGGRGEMTLIDEDDVLESGIDLIAQPPGKRLQNVLLLSGGEKAMAALALVLAIFQYRPSPFCILDEVDAPLDEVNVGRFAEKIIEMSLETQFLMITHNKRTMEAARALYGVTMEEPGVSKLVSVKFE
jgi:chromosome segregation protein